jgi:hypothetical protein
MIAKYNPTFWECPPPMGFTYGKAQGKIYHEPSPLRSWGVGVGEILCPLLDSEKEYSSHYLGVSIKSLPFSRREIDEYKVPSKYTTHFLWVL